MNNFDPFGGGEDRSDKNGPYDNYSQNTNNNNKKIKSLITWIIILAILGGIVYYLFFNNTTVTFNVKNTEGKSISANIIISKSEDLSVKTQKILSTDSITLRKGTYYYSVQNKDYSSKKGEFVLNEKNQEIKVDPLEKNIKLKLIDITAPSIVFAGQNLKFSVEVENTSPTEDYNIDNFVFGGIIKDVNNFYLTDIYDNEIDKSSFKIPAQTKQTINFNIIIPKTTKIADKQTIEVRIKYKLDKKTTTLNVQKEPIITISPGNIKTSLTSGESQTFKIKINNSKNKTPIADIIISLDINSEINENINNWFNYPINQILVDSQETSEQILTITIPSSARAEKITGNIYVKSSSLNLDQNIPLEIEIKEPNISFVSGIMNKTINLIYDQNTNTLSEEYRTLSLENKSKVNIKVIDYSIENGTDTNDCSNFIYISESYSNITVLPGTKQEAIINIKARDINNLMDLVGSSRLCPIKINYENPYREGEYLSSLENLTIYFK